MYCGCFFTGITYFAVLGVLHSNAILHDEHDMLDRPSYLKVKRGEA